MTLLSRFRLYFTNKYKNTLLQILCWGTNRKNLDGCFKIIPSILRIITIHMYLTTGKGGGASVAQQVKHLPLGFGSGHDLTIHGFKPLIGLYADGREPAWDSLSLPLSVSPLSAHVLSLSENKYINSKKKKKKKKKELEAACRSLIYQELASSNSNIEQWFSTGDNFAAGDTQRYLEAFLIITTWISPLEFSEQKPGLLLNYNAQDSFLQQRIIQPLMSIALALRLPGVRVDDYKTVFLEFRRNTAVWKHYISRISYICLYFQRHFQFPE